MIDPANVKAVADSLSPLHICALYELSEFYGQGPGHLAPILNISIKNARSILQFFHQQGIVDFGFLMCEDNGMLAGRGYWLDSFGKAVKQEVENRCHRIR